MYEFLNARVQEFMTTPVVSVQPDITVAEIEGRFAAQDFNGFPVVENGLLIGVVTKFDVLKVFVFTPRSVVPHYEELATRTARQIMTRDVITFRPDTPLTRVLQTMIDFRIKSFPVVDGKHLVGMVAREDIVRALRTTLAR